jgi:hypothetical protein
MDRLVLSLLPLKISKSGLLSMVKVRALVVVSVSLLFKPSDFELKAIYSEEITPTREDLGLVAKKTITVTVIDLDDEAPTNIRIKDAKTTDINGFVTLANDMGDDFVIGTLSATDPDTDTTTNALVTVMVLVATSASSPFPVLAVIVTE